MRQTDGQLELPAGWARTRLGDLAAYINGRGFKKAEWSAAGRPIIRIQNLTGSSRKYNRYEGEVDPRHLVPDGTLLISWAATIDAFIYRGEEGALNQHIFKVEPFVDKMFLFYLVRFVVPGLMERAHGSGMQHVTRGVFDNYPVALPPLAEQSRIVDALEAAFADLNAGVAAVEAAQRDLDRYRRSVLRAAVEGALTADWRRQHPDAEPAAALLERVLDERREQWEADQFAKYESKGKKPPKSWRQRYKLPVEPETEGLSDLPGGWTWVTVDQIGRVRSGITKNRAKASETWEEVPYLSVANVQRGYLDLAEVKTIRAPAHKIAETLLHVGDILFNEGGDIDKLGRGWIWEGQLPRCSHQNHVFRVTLYSDAIEPKLVSWTGNTLGQRYFMEAGKQTTNLASINQSKLKSLPIPLPPHAEQSAIVEAVEERLSVAAAAAAELDRQRARADRLRQAVLKRAFAGELVPQDPTDEPASVLLERVQKELAERKKTTKTRKRKRTMSTPDPALPASLVEIVEADGPVEPRDLWKRSGIESIDAFYADLKTDVEAGLLAEQVQSPTKRVIVRS